MSPAPILFNSQVNTLRVCLVSDHFLTATPISTCLVTVHVQRTCTSILCTKAAA